MSYLFGGFPAMLRILVVGTLSYLALIVFIRLAGQRPLGRMQTFDLIVAVAIGSTLGRLMTAQEVQFSEAVTAFALLLGLHYVVSRLAYRFPHLARWMETPPTLVFYRGKGLPDPMRRSRLTEAELLAAARKAGLSSLKQVEAIVLETDGSFSVLKEQPADGWSTLQGIDPDRT
ncbi:MAG TPA: YetF domain-containing protein [Stenomitos sp.]